ncbi:hypothetical protein F4803DRAFT_545378 [Xylaria telfairii]|nr:hypothetical protein F4803DRAFT_545378 [Xylaria telfairii]
MLQLFRPRCPHNATIITMSFTTPPALTGLSLTTSTAWVQYPSRLILTNFGIGSCVEPAGRPQQRFDHRYLSIGIEPSEDLLRTVPLRGKKRRLTPSPKRNISPDRCVDDDAVFPESIITETEARPIINEFRKAILTTGQTKCAISHKQGAWWPGGGMGIVMEAAHIVPQVHWSKYPTRNQAVAALDDCVALRDAWEATWHMSNGLLLSVQIYQLFNARIISIEPTTKRIRVFMPCDVLVEYHGKHALLPKDVSVSALRYHYDMCCIENMTAKKPLIPPSRPLKMNSQIIHAATSKMPSAKGDPSKPELPTQDSERQDKISKNHSDTCQERMDLPSSPPSGEPGMTRRLWRSGGLWLTSEQEADELRQKGWFVYEVSSDEKEEEERGRPRKRLCRTVD